MYSTILPNTLEPNFPILMITSRYDHIVSTEDVAKGHFLAGNVEEYIVEVTGHLGVVTGKGSDRVAKWVDEYRL